MKSKNAAILLILLTLGISGGWGRPEFKKTRERLPFQYRRFPPPVVSSQRNDALPPSRSLTLPNFDSNYSPKKSEDLLVASANLINPVGFDFMKILIPQRSKTYVKSFRPVIPLAWVDLPHFDNPVFGQESPPGPVLIVKQKPSENIAFSRQILEQKVEGSKDFERNGRKLEGPFGKSSQFDSFSQQQPHQPRDDKNEDKNSSSSDSKDYASERQIIGFSIDPDRMARNYAESTTRLPLLKAVPTVGTRPTTVTRPAIITIPTTLKMLTMATPTTTTTARTTSTSTGKPVERFITNRNDNQSQDSVFSESKKEERRTENGPMVGFGLANPIAAATVNRPAFTATASATATTNDRTDSSKSSSNYEYGYSVSNLETKDVKSHSERREGDLVQGEYSVLEPDGYTRIVKYFVDSGGFHASVRRIRI